MRDGVSSNCFNCHVKITIHKSWAAGPVYCRRCGKDDKIGLDRYRSLPSFLEKQGCLSCGSDRLKINMDDQSYRITSICPKCRRIRHYGITGHELKSPITPFLEEVDI